MAIIKTITTDRGVVYPDQYCRVDEVVTTKTAIRFTIGVYQNSSEAAEGKPPHRAEIFHGSYDLFGDNPWVQAYTALKVYWPEAVDA